MANHDVDALTQKVDDIGRKVDTLSATVDTRFADVDLRLADIDEHFVEQRQYTEFAFDALRAEMHAGFQRVDRRFDRIEDKLDRFIDTQGGRKARSRRKG